MRRSQTNLNSQHKAWILDVGHGNAAVIEHAGNVSIVDGGRTGTLTEFLSQQGISKVDTVIVSHADADHFSGILRLLRNSQVEVGNVYVNPDNRDSLLWRDFQSEMASFRDQGVGIWLELTHVNPGSWQQGRTWFEILGPLQEDAAGTVGGLNAMGQPLNSNRMSGVVRVWVDGSPKILLPGDVDQVGLDRLLEYDHDLSAEVLVFPHHGGLPGDADPVAFAERLITAVHPEVVVFSIGRGRNNTPRPEIVSAVKNSAPNVRIACTQLSERCADVRPQQLVILHDVIAQGRLRSACCAGTMAFSLEGALSYLPDRAAHDGFIAQNARNALCKQ